MACQSWIRRPATRIEPSGNRPASSGVVTPFSIAPVSVTTLNVEPARTPRSPRGPCARRREIRPASLGSNVGQLATASSSPDSGSWTMTVPAFACVSSIAARQFFFRDVLDVFVERERRRSRPDRQPTSRAVVPAALRVGHHHHSARACRGSARRASIRFRPCPSHRCPRNPARARQARACG